MLDGSGIREVILLKAERDAEKMSRLETSNIATRVLQLLHTQSGRVAIEVDDDGVPVVDYGRRLFARIGPKRSAVTIGIVGLKATQSGSLVGLADFDTTGDEVSSRVSVEKMAQWLLASSIDKGDYMVYHYDFSWPTYLLVPPWRSCLPEAFCGMFLIAYGKSTGNEQYVDCGLKHLMSLTVPVSEGGLKCDNSTVFLEYVDYEKSRRFPIVLNGHLYCMITLFNAWRLLGISEFKVAFDHALSELESLLPTFEGPFFTYYDDYGNPALAFYHRIHIHLLEELYALTKLPYLYAVAFRWRRLLPRYNFLLSLLARCYALRIPYLPRR